MEEDDDELMISVSVHHVENEDEFEIAKKVSAINANVVDVTDMLQKAKAAFNHQSGERDMYTHEEIEFIGVCSPVAIIGVCGSLIQATMALEKANQRIKELEGGHDGDS